jgi:hypothetical protein
MILIKFSKKIPVIKKIHNKYKHYDKNNINLVKIKK